MTYSDDAMDVQFYRHATLSMFEIRKCFNWRMHFIYRKMKSILRPDRNKRNATRD